MGDVTNLKPWKPGQSGNVTGRPKGSDLKAILLARLSEESDGCTTAERFVDALLHVAIEARDVRAMKLVLEYVVGRPTQALAVDMSVRHEGDPRERLAELLGLTPEEIPPAEDFLSPK